LACKEYSEIKKASRKILREACNQSVLVCV